MIEYLLVLARRQIRCPLPGCPFLFVSKLNSPPIVCSFAVVLCIALEDHLQIITVGSGKRKGKYTGKICNVKEECGLFLKLSFLIYSLQHKIYPQRWLHGCSECRWPLMQGEKKNKENCIGNRTYLMQNNQRIWSPNGCKKIPDKKGWEQMSTVVLFSWNENEVQSEV